MSSRTPFRIIQLLFILLRLPRLFFKRKKKPKAQRILIFHQLLLGDALMATGLLASLRAKYPDAEIDIAGPPFLKELYSSKPYKVDFVPFAPRELKTFLHLRRRKTYDHAYLVMDNRFSWTAFALGVQWIIGYEKGARYKNFPLNEELSLPVTETSLTDLMAGLAGEVSTDIRFDKGDWPTPLFDPFDLPEVPYAVLHLGASTPLKYWPAERWLEVARYLKNCGITPLWSAGKNELHLIDEVDSRGEFQSYGGKLSLSQLWHLIDQACLLIAPDTGIVHIAKHTETPVICLFGPGSDKVAGQSNFFSTPFYYPVSHQVDCRNQHILFKRPVPWVSQCKRSVRDCPFEAKCMSQISVAEVVEPITKILSKSRW